MYTSIVGDATVTGAGNCAVSALPCLETQPPSGLHRAVGDPRHPSLTGIQGPLLGQFGVGRPFRLAKFCGRDQVGRGAGVKAVVYDRYGSPDLLRVEEVPVPSPAAGQVRVKIAATSVNLSDWECLRGSPAYARIGGLRLPACRTLGSDIAGLVDDVGEGVTRFRPGDEVYGDNLRLKGGFAEYTLAPESALAHKPAQLSFVEASTIPQAGAIALQGTKRAVTGRRVLINGAGGGSGSFAIQLAKRLGAHVTGVDNAAKLDFMRSVGADHVIDYRRDDFTRTSQPYDHVRSLAHGLDHPLFLGGVLDPEAIALGVHRVSAPPTSSVDSEPGFSA